MRLLILALIGLTGPALATPVTCTFDRDCVSSDNCTAIDYTVTASGLNGPMTLTLPDYDTPAQGAANAMAEGRVMVIAQIGFDLSVLMNLRRDGTADALISTMSGSRSLFGRCAGAAS